MVIVLPPRVDLVRSFPHKHMISWKKSASNFFSNFSNFWNFLNQWNHKNWGYQMLMSNVSVSYKSLCLKPAVNCLLLMSGRQWTIASQLPLLLVGYETPPSICSRSRLAPARLCRVVTIYQRPFCLMDTIHSFPACSLAGTRQSPLGNESTANAHNHTTADEWQDQNLSDSKWFSHHCWADFVFYTYCLLLLLDV